MGFKGVLKDSKGFQMILSDFERCQGISRILKDFTPVKGNVSDSELNARGGGKFDHLF